MKVGIIGLGRMGEGMSRRMLKGGIETYGYRRNYDKAQEAAERGYITAAADSLESLVQVVKKDGEPGIFQFANVLLWTAIPLVLSTIYFGLRKGENNYYETDKYDGNGTAH